MYLSPWLIGTIIALAGLAITAFALISGRRNGRDTKIIADVKERAALDTKVTTLLATIESLTKTVNEGFARIESRYESMERTVQEHDRDIAVLKSKMRIEGGN